MTFECYYGFDERNRVPWKLDSLNAVDRSSVVKCAGYSKGKPVRGFRLRVRATMLKIFEQVRKTTAAKI